MREMDVFRALFPRSGGAQPGRTRAYSGTALSDSSGGRVVVAVEGDSLTADGTNEVEVPCSPSVRAGDAVLVEGVDGSPIVTYAAGEGDRQDSEIAAAATAAAEAQAVAEATNQHFWTDTNGVHVSTDADTAAGAHNVLLNALGFLIRKAAATMVSVTSSATAFFDGLGSAAANVVAQFGRDGATIGYTSGRHLSIDSDSVDIMNGSVEESTFSGTKVELAKNSAAGSVEFCGGMGELTYQSIMQQVYMAGPAGAALTVKNDGQGAVNAFVGLYDSPSLGGPEVILRAAYYELAGETLGTGALATAIGGWVVESGASGDWTWRKYRDGTVEAWCRQSTAVRHDITSPYYEFYYEAVGGWSITGLSGYTLSFVSITPEFDKAVWATVRYVGTTAFNFYLLARESISDVGRVQVYCRGTWS